MYRNLQYAFLTLLTLGLLGMVSFVVGTLFAGFGSEGCSPVRHSLDNMAFQMIWIGSLCLGSLIPCILIWRQRLYAAMSSTLPFGLCSCCAYLVFIGSIC